MPSRQTSSMIVAAAFAIFAAILFYFGEDHSECCKSSISDTTASSLDMHHSSESKQPKTNNIKKTTSSGSTKANKMTLLDELTDAATGLSLPRTKRFSRSELTCLGVGVRAKSITVAKVNVYTVGLYVDPRPARGALKKYAQSDPAKLKGDASVFKVLEHPGGFTKYLHLVFARTVGAHKVVDALTSMKGVDMKVLDRFSSLILGAIGKNIGKGETISLGWEGKDRMVVIVRDEVAGTVYDPSLPKAVFNMYLGSDPVSPPAKAAFAEGVPTLFGN